MPQKRNYIAASFDCLKLVYTFSKLMQLKKQDYSMCFKLWYKYGGVYSLHKGFNYDFTNFLHLIRVEKEAQAPNNYLSHFGVNVDYFNKLIIQSFTYSYEITFYKNPSSFAICIYIFITLDLKCNGSENY